ncbi:MAG: ASKHA domain-containing protein [Desulfobacterales bacterium]|nr:ASKHA domain-containing protein [Desulfobacterales bacterium]
MSSFTVTFLPHNNKVSLDADEPLIRAAMAAGVHVNASCGGQGVCGKCRVIIESGEVAGGISEKLSQADIAAGVRLACQTRILSDVVVRIPTESAVDASVLNKTFGERRTARIRQMNFNDLKEQGLFMPPVEKRYLALPEPTPQDNLADTSRLISFLNANFGDHRLEVDLPVLRKIPDVLRADGFRVTATIARPVRPDGKNRIIDIQPGDTTDRSYAVAVDIGTTTVFGQLLDLNSGEVLAQHGDFNSQISYGEDVISRIVFSEKNGMEKLQAAVLKTTNQIIDRIVRKAAIDRDNITQITLAGNTTMTQLFCGINPRHIRRSPYVPASTLYPPIRAVELGLALGEHVMALFYPQISSYVGGDIVAGVMGSGMYRHEELTLFMDIGTNAELVIGNKDWMACAACSAGPAFEGGGIKFGMRAEKGAIEDFSLDPLTFEPMNITVGNVGVRGICGSGLINIVAALFEAGVIDNLGKFNRDLPTDRVRATEGIWEYVLARAEVTQIGRDVVLTEIDIDNLIRAKGALYSGCMTLLDEVGLGMENLERIILAGGFGSYVDLEKAMTIGLLPEIELDKVTFVGNSSLLGARMSSLTNRIRRDVTAVTRMMTNFELSETPSYMDHYVAALFLPHTDINLFPKVKERMAARRHRTS